MLPHRLTLELSQGPGLLLQIVREEADADGWARLNMVGTRLFKRDPAFDARKLGLSSTKLGNLVESLDIFETQKVGTTVFVRHRQPS